jgi:L-alanine-DL-glutamate epimerase-like enolase superfamily enzyme
MGSHQDLAQIFPAIEGEDPRAVSALYDRMLARVFKASHAGATFGGIGTFDMALWDIKAKLAGEPLWRLLGGRDRFVSGYASGLDIALDDDELALFYSEMAGRGFTSGKLKGGRNVASDIRRLGIIRDALRVNIPEPGLMLDANESWNLKQAVRYVSRIEEVHDLVWIEEPIRADDFFGCSQIRKEIRTPIQLGENFMGPEQMAQALAAGACDYAMPDAERIGGVTGFMRAAALAQGAGIEMSSHLFPEMSCHVLAATPTCHWLEYVDWAEPILKDALVLKKGFVQIPERPGLGMEWDEKAVTRFAV